MSIKDEVTVNLDYKRPKYLIMMSRTMLFILLPVCMYLGANSVILSVLTVFLFIVCTGAMIGKMVSNGNKNKHKFNNKKDFVEWANNLEDWS